MQKDIVLPTYINSTSDPFRLPLACTLPFFRRAAVTAARPFLSWVLALPEYRELYERAQSAPGSTFCERALRVLDISIAPADGTAVPPAGPLIVVSNHPHGIVDGLALCEIVGRSRRDVRVLTNDLLAPIPELAEMCLFVNVFGSRAAARTHAGLRAAIRWLQDGHALIVFPAGAVASRDWQRSQTPIDDEWRPTVGRLALTSGARVMPAHIAGRNSESFYRAGQFHAGLRTLLLMRELLAKRGQRIVVQLGRPLALARHSAPARNGTTVTALLRAEVESLGHSPDPGGARRAAVNTRRDDLSADISRLGAEHRLLQSGRFTVYCAPASCLPAVLPEIGRLREESFSAVGEGTGRSIDLDRFDGHYEQLFVWDHEARAVAGAYRLGPVDRIVAEHGIGGLYTSTLYRYDQRLLSQLGPAMELGRSFVRTEYQRSSNTLLLLWKGIAEFVSRSRHYRVLFGPVSISARYTDMSRRLLQAFLLQNAQHRELADLVAAMTPPPGSSIDISTTNDVRALDRLIAGQEPDGKGIPVLLRQYLRLNAKLLAFNIDPAFGDALDALMMVDLAHVDRAILTRYFGAGNAQRFLGGTSRPVAA